MRHRHERSAATAYTVWHGSPHRGTEAVSAAFAAVFDRIRRSSVSGEDPVVDFRAELLDVVRAFARDWTRMTPTPAPQQPTATVETAEYSRRRVSRLRSAARRAADRRAVADPDAVRRVLGRLGELEHNRSSVQRNHVWLRDTGADTAQTITAWLELRRLEREIVREEEKLTRLGVTAPPQPKSLYADCADMAALQAADFGCYVDYSADETPSTGMTLNGAMVFTGGKAVPAYAYGSLLDGVQAARQTGVDPRCMITYIEPGFPGFNGIDGHEVVLTWHPDHPDDIVMVDPANDEARLPKPGELAGPGRKSGLIFGESGFPWGVVNVGIDRAFRATTGARTPEG